MDTYCHTLEPSIVTTNPYAATRAQFRLSQAEWATAFGVSRSTVSAWELGRVLPSPAAQAAYRQLQVPILQGDLHQVADWRERLLNIGEEARQEAERLNRERAGGGLIKAVVVTAAALAIAKLLGELFKEDR